MFHLFFEKCETGLPRILPGSVDLVLADPPYGKTRCEWDTPLDFDALWPYIERAVRPSAAIIFTAKQPFTSELIMSRTKLFRYCWVWEKSNATGHLNANRQPMQAHEDIVVFYKNQPTYNPQKTDGHSPMNAVYSKPEKSGAVYGRHAQTNSRKGATDRYPRSVIRFPNVTVRTVHPTQKPVELMEYLIRTYSNPGDTVLDFTMGSGTTGVACANTGRRFVGMEKGENEFSIAKSRIVEAYSNRQESPDDV